MSTLGDLIRDMDDEELAQLITSSIDCNRNESDVYKVNLNEKILVVIDADDLAYRLGEECEDD